MSNEYKLGQLESVGLREIWKTEAGDFTPWLAREENLAILGKTLNIDLELKGQEENVGRFRADILCQEVYERSFVLIENQLAQTDHGHLGQLLTYAAGLDAVTVVWIAAEFTDEHRAALDWLNEKTDDNLRFFGLEVELWRIGDSPCAPKFNIVSEPNDWSRSISRRVKSKEISSSRSQLASNYLDGLLKALDDEGSVVRSDQKLHPALSLWWFNFRFVRTGFRLSAEIRNENGQDRLFAQVHIGLYITPDVTEAYFQLLHKDREEIENEIGYELIWENKTDRTRWIEVEYPHEIDRKNRDDWPRQHKWLAEKLNELHPVFVDRVKKLNAEDWTGPKTDDGSENT